MNIKDKIKKVFCERKEDENQIKNAESLFSKILLNSNKAEKTFGEKENIFCFNKILGYELYSELQEYIKKSAS
jgi:hypothetical protein